MINLHHGCQRDPLCGSFLFSEVAIERGFRYTDLVLGTSTW